MTRFAWAGLVDGWAKPVPRIASINATETSNLVIVPPCFAAGGADVRTSSSPGAKYEAWLMELRVQTRGLTHDSYHATSSVSVGRAHRGPLRAVAEYIRGCTLRRCCAELPR